MKSVAVLLAAVLLSTAVALVSVYKVEPVKAAWSGKVKYEEGVWQSITCNFDEPIYSEYFTGTATNGQYQVQLKFPGLNGLVVAHGDTNMAGDHKWVRCYFHVDYPESIIKGRTYWVKWTLSSGPDSLAFYYDSTDQYRYGCLTVPPLMYDNGDLACRVMGRMNPVDSTNFGACEVSWWLSLTHDTMPGGDTLTFDTLQFRSIVESSKVRAVRFDLDWNLVQYGGPNCWETRDSHPISALCAGQLFSLGLAPSTWWSAGQLPVKSGLDFVDKLRASQWSANHGAATDLRYATQVLSFLQ